MKTHFKLIAVAIALMPTLFHGQAAFDKFETDANFTTVTVTKKTFSMLAQIKTEGSEKDIQEVKELAKKLRVLKLSRPRKTHRLAI